MYIMQTCKHTCVQAYNTSCAERAYKNLCTHINTHIHTCTHTIYIHACIYMRIHIHRTCMQQRYVNTSSVEANWPMQTASTQLMIGSARGMLRACGVCIRKSVGGCRTTRITKKKNRLRIVCLFLFFIASQKSTQA
jgi:hypothetical protein